MELPHSISAPFFYTFKTRKWSYLLVLKSKVVSKKINWQKNLEAFWILGSLWIRLFALWWDMEQDKHFWKFILGFVELDFSVVKSGGPLMPAWPHSFWVCFQKSCPLTLKENTRTSKHILKAKLFSGMVLKIFSFGHLENSVAVRSSGYGQRLSRRSTALDSPQPAAIAPTCCVVLTQSPEKWGYLIVFISKSKKRGCGEPKTKTPQVSNTPCFL